MGGVDEGQRLRFPSDQLFNAKGCVGMTTTSWKHVMNRAKHCSDTDLSAMGSVARRCKADACWGQVMHTLMRFS